MKIKKYATIGLLTLSPLLFYSKNPKNNNGEGQFIIEPTEYFLPSFPEIKMYDKRDTFEYQGNVIGQIVYTLPEGKYLIEIKHGIDSITGEKGDYFKPYCTEVKIKKGKNEMKILRDIEAKLTTKN